MNLAYPIDTAAREAYPVSDEQPVVLGDGDPRRGLDLDALARDGWEAAGAVSEMRVYRENGDPAVIEKRGTFPETYWKGQIADEYGAAVAPTAISWDGDPLALRDEPERYELVQAWLPHRFADVYPDVADSAVRDLAANAAVMDGLGFGMELGGVNRLDHIPEFLTDPDRERCYIVDFGFEFGGPERLVGDRAEPRTLAREEARGFLDAADLPLFEERYEELRGEVERAVGAVTPRPAAPR